MPSLAVLQTKTDKSFQEGGKVASRLFHPTLHLALVSFKREPSDFNAF